MIDALTAFRDVDFSWVRSLESVWTETEAPATSGPNGALADEIVATLVRETKDPTRKPLGRVLVGQAGIGKTHLVVGLRRKIWDSGGWFVLLDVIGITDFWKSAALSFLTSLLQEMPDGRRQYEAVLAGIARRLNVESQVEAAFGIPNIDAKLIVDLLIPGLARISMSETQTHQDVFRALALLRSPDFGAVAIAHSWLQGYEADEPARRALGLIKPPPSPVDIVRGISWVMSLAGPTLIAVDQIDGIINSGGVSIENDGLGERTSFSDILGAGLLQLYDKVARSQTVVTCLRESWNVMEAGLKSAAHRFQTPPVVLVGMNQSAAIADLIASRLAPSYGSAGFTPPYPSWPFTPTALDSAIGIAPRGILMRCDAFRRRCLDAGEVVPCETIGGDVTPEPPVATDHVEASFDRELRQARAAASLDGILDEKDDGKLGRLLREAFDLYVKQIVPRETIDVESRGDPAQKMPPLHGRLTFTHHDENDREQHFCFRAIEHAHATSFQARLRAALTASGISGKISDRHLLIVRRGPIPSGAKTKLLTDAFLAAGGLILDPSDDDLKTFLALGMIHDAAVARGDLAAFEAWLQTSVPLCGTAFFKVAGLCPPPGMVPLPGVDLPRAVTPSRDEPVDLMVRAGDAGVSNQEGGPAMAPPEPLVVRDGLRPPHHEGVEEAPKAAPAPDSIPVGHRIGGDAVTVSIPTKVLPRHTAIIAGAGSGKTVLLRRIVEEAALAGIPAIVVDPNNDLSRLGDPWPERPGPFTDEDAAKAARYASSVEVVVWTPGIHAGNPLFLSVLPDFSALGDDIDEREQAVGMAADTLGPLAGAKTNILKGVLADALRAFAAKGGGTLKDMIALLADLPDGVSEIGNADRHAAKMSDELRAAIATNPLLKATGAVLDPAVLFRSEVPGKTRVSVVNLSGLASDEAKEDFVNRLQMTLFGWVKKHPSPKGLLYVIDEAQIFIPSGAGALSKTSGVQLVAQARKYGLGMVVATQAPKGIDNKVVSNCTTQFLGKQNAPATIDAARELIAASGGRADDFGKLKMAEFYFKTEASGKPVKIATPICLSWHPANPPTPDEVVGRAKRSAP